MDLQHDSIPGFNRGDPDALRQLPDAIGAVEPERPGPVFAVALAAALAIVAVGIAAGAVAATRWLARSHGLVAP